MPIAGCKILEMETILVRSYYMGLKELFRTWNRREDIVQTEADMVMLKGD